MNYDPIFDKWHEECGVFGVFDRTVDVARYVYWGLFALQHRGQESAGIAITDGNEVALKKGMGLLTEATLEATERKAVTGVGAPWYTSGIHSCTEVDVLGLFDVFEHVAAQTATEAVPHAERGAHVEAAGFLVVERA